MIQQRFEHFSRTSISVLSLHEKPLLPGRPETGDTLETRETPNGLGTDPERTPNGLRTDPERTPNGPPGYEIFSETRLVLPEG